MADLSDTRRKNLNALCVRRGWVSQKNPLVGSPSKLVEVLGRTSSFWSDRLKPDGKAIGEDLAREIFAAGYFALFSPVSGMWTP